MNGKRSLRGNSGNNNAKKPDMNHLPQEKDLTSEQKQQMQQLKKYADKYKNKSEADIMNEIGTLAAKSRASGMLSDQQMETFKSKLEPMLDTEQKKKLNNIINKIKNN